MKLEQYRYPNGEQMFNSDTRARNATHTALGRTLDGEPYGLVISDAPNVIIAGPTASGKSEMIHTMLITMMSHATPRELEIYIADIKGVEFNEYNNAPHVKSKVLREEEHIGIMLELMIKEAADRRSKLANAVVKDIHEYNNLITSEDKFLANIVIFIDEYAYLTRDSNWIKESIIKLAREGGNTGIHLVITSQTLSKRVVTDELLNEFPTRVLRGSFNGDSKDLYRFLRLPQKRESVSISHNGELTEIKAELINHDLRVKVIKELKGKYPLKSSSSSTYNFSLELLNNDKKLQSLIKDLF